MLKFFGITIALFFCLVQIGCISQNKKDILSTSICDTSNVTYTNTIQPTMSTYCVSCHNSASPSAGVNLEGYSNVKSFVDNGQLWGTMNHSAGFSPMPKGVAKLDNCTLSKLLSWINKGALNN